MLQRLIATPNDLTPLLVRLTLELVILPHGLQKAFGLFGGFGYSGTMQYFTDTLGIPYMFGVLAILAETVGGLMLIFGVLLQACRFWDWCDDACSGPDRASAKWVFYELVR